MGYRPFRCEVSDCNKTFNEKGNLRTHMRSHSGLKPYKCLEIGCNASFKFSTNLKYHLRTHNKNNKNFYCIYCPQTFTRYISLQSHLKIHKEEELIPCSETLLKSKRADTAEELINSLHPKETKADKLKKNDQKETEYRHRLSISTLTGLSNSSMIPIEVNDINLKSKSNDSPESKTHNIEDLYYDFNRNLKFLLDFTESSYIPSDHSTNLSMNLKLQLGILLQNHESMSNSMKMTLSTEENNSFI